MEYKYYKNGNIHVRYDSDIDGYNDEHTYAAMCCIIYNSMLDCVEYNDYNSYFSSFSIINHANGRTYDYLIPYDDIDKFFDGKWIILYGKDEHAYIKIPSFYDVYDIRVNKKWYALYKLCDIPSIDFMKEMNRHGCLFNAVSPQYAPEIKHCAMLVPHGSRIEYM